MVSVKICLAFFSYNVCIGQPDDRKFFRKLSLQCLILDEGHMLKNMASQRYSYLMRIKVSFKGLTLSIGMQEICNFRWEQWVCCKYIHVVEYSLSCLDDTNCYYRTASHFVGLVCGRRYCASVSYQARRRVLLTGTPLQNNLLELMSLLSFIMPVVFQKYTDQLKKTFSRAKVNYCSQFEALQAFEGWMDEWMDSVLTCNLQNLYVQFACHQLVFLMIRNAVFGWKLICLHHTAEAGWV